MIAIINDPEEVAYKDPKPKIRCNDTINDPPPRPRPPKKPDIVQK